MRRGTGRRKSDMSSVQALLHKRPENFPFSRPGLESLVNQLENQTDIIKNVDSWLKEYKVSHHYIIDLSSHHFPFSPSL